MALNASRFKRVRRSFGEPWSRSHRLDPLARSARSSARLVPKAGPGRPPICQGPHFGTTDVLSGSECPTTRRILAHRHRHRETERDRERGTRTQRQTHRHGHRHRDTETQRHRDAETQREMETHGHRDTDTHRNTDTRTQTHTETHMHTQTPAHPHAQTPTCPDAHMPTGKHARVQFPSWRHASPFSTPGPTPQCFPQSTPHKQAPRAVRFLVAQGFSHKQGPYISPRTSPQNGTFLRHRKTDVQSH